MEIPTVAAANRDQLEQTPGSLLEFRCGPFGPEPERNLTALLDDI